MATPTNFTGTALSASQVKLNWKDNSSAGNTFEIQYSRGFDFKDFKTLVTPANATTATVEGLSKNKVYYFRVREIGVGSARSSWSSKLTVRTLNTGGPVVNPPAPTPVITAFMLVNSDTNQPVYQISEGEQLSKSSILAYLGVQNFSIQANTDGGVKSVKFGYQGNGNYSKENNAPFVLFGNSGADIFGKSAAIGSYTVSATGYTGQQSDRNGQCVEDTALQHRGLSSTTADLKEEGLRENRKLSLFWATGLARPNRRVTFSSCPCPSSCLC